MTIIQNSLSAAAPELSTGGAGIPARDSVVLANAGLGACTCQREEAPEPAGNVVELYPGASEAKKSRPRLTASEAGMATAEYASIVSSYLFDKLVL